MLSSNYLHVIRIAIIYHEITHSRPQRTRSFWSALRIKTEAGQSQFLSMGRNSFYNFQPIRFVRFDNESVNRGLPVLGAARGLDSTKGIVASGDENGNYRDI